jgi:hypothetical protein
MRQLIILTVLDIADVISKTVIVGHMSCIKVIRNDIILLKIHKSYMFAPQT